MTNQEILDLMYRHYKECWTIIEAQQEEIFKLKKEINKLIIEGK